MSQVNQITATNCPCDELVFPPLLHIPAGLEDLPRQPASFSEYRQAMLRAVGTKYPLRHWHARQEDDFGVMLLEMWAYLCDSLGFYDQIIAQELYLRTAKERPSISKLVDLLGYIPRPAVAATALLAARADGRKTVELPLGTAFRSGAFDEEPPQVFELDAKEDIIAFTNEWTVEPPRSNRIWTAHPSRFYVEPLLEIKEDSLLLLAHTTTMHRSLAATVSALEQVAGIDGKQYTQLDFPAASDLLSGTRLNRLKLYQPTQTARLWTITSPSVITGTRTRLVLDKVYPDLQTGQYVVVSKNGEYRPFKINRVRQLMREPQPTNTATINGVSYDIPGISVPVTEIRLDVSINASGRRDGGADWTDSDRNDLNVHFAMELAGKVVNLPRKHLQASDPIRLETELEESLDEELMRDFLLEDLNLDATQVRGQLAIEDQQLNLAQGESWQPALRLPVKVFGNVLQVSRGETVPAEQLGFGDGSQSNQQFPLQKKPLTYLAAPSTESGVMSSLKIYVDNILWTEVNSFYGLDPQDQVYIVRQDEDEVSTITFGDGIRGQRLATGSSVVASYRFGAGAAAPPGGSINQIASPVEGLSSVHNPLSAFGGSDAEATDELRTYAPASALVLGRAVSLADMQAVAAAIPGVRRAQTDWRWDDRKQRPVLLLWYIGEGYLGALISERLRSLSDPNTPIQVIEAQAIPVNLTLDVQIDENFALDAVAAAIREHLIERDGSFLRSDQQAIGQPFYRSRLFAEILAISGTLSVTGVVWNGLNFSSFAKRPPAGKYFDFEVATLTITLNKVNAL